MLRQSERGGQGGRLKHLEQQSPTPKLVAEQPGALGGQRSQSRGKSYLIAVGMAVCLISLTGWGLTSLLGARHTDRVSEKERTQLVVAFNQLKSVELPAVSESELTGAIDSMQLSPADRAALVKELALSSSSSRPLAPPADARQVPAPPLSASAQKLTLAWITVWDTHAEDGDIVQIQSGGYRREVTLMNRPTQVAVPVPPNGILNITGIRDGGGGITIGAMSGTSTVALPLMSEGQVIGIPVTAR